MTTYEELLEKYGMIPDTRVGVNENGENVIVSIDEECACITTMQHNRWMRTNIYYPDGWEEEYYSK